MDGFDRGLDSVLVDHGIRVGSPHEFDIQKLGKSKRDDEGGKHDAFLVHVRLGYAKARYCIRAHEMDVVFD